MAKFRAMPYAKAIFDLISDESPGRVEEVQGELERMAEAATNVPELIKVMVAPVLPPSAKTEILDQVLDAVKVKEPARRLLHVVQQHYRLEYMSQIAETYRELVDRSLGRTRATVELVGEVGASEQVKVVAAIKAAVGTDVVAKFETNPELLAGFRIQVGSRVFDGSLVGQLDRLSQQTQI